MSGRRQAKALLEALLVMMGPAALARWAFRRRGVVLAFHNIVPRGERPGADRSLHLPEATFCQQLDLLERYAEVVPLGDLLVRSKRPVSLPRVAITFDDAYSGAVAVGLGELARRGLPATVFVSPGCLGSEGFWWDRVTTPKSEVLPEAFRAIALETAQGRSDAVLALAREHGLLVGPVPAHARPASEADLAIAVQAPGITLGAHTWSHPNLAVLSPVELSAELGPPLNWLRTRFARVEPWLAYPYGLSSPVVEAAAAEAGYTTAYLVRGGWLPVVPAAALRQPRLNIPAGLSAHGFTLRTAGLLAS